MKKYKLIQEYPTVPSIKLGTIITQDGPKQATGHIFRTPDYIAVWNPQNYPKHWEEVNEKEYKVLTMIGSTSQGNTFYKVNEDETISSWINPKKSVEEALSFGYTIYSVKRLSDGEIFSISNHVGYNCKDLLVIKEFKIKNNRLYIKYSNSPEFFDDWLCSNFNKFRPILFTTEDNIDIYPGDTYWCVNTAPHLWSIFEQTSKEKTKLNKTVLAFYSECKALDYLVENKPTLSLKEVKETLLKDGPYKFHNQDVYKFDNQDVARLNNLASLKIIDHE